jgi:hypothetical protein
VRLVVLCPDDPPGRRKSKKPKGYRKSVRFKTEAEKKAYIARWRKDNPGMVREWSRRYNRVHRPNKTKPQP